MLYVPRHIVSCWSEQSMMVNWLGPQEEHGRHDDVALLTSEKVPFSHFLHTVLDRVLHGTMAPDPYVHKSQS